MITITVEGPQGEGSTTMAVDIAELIESKGKTYTFEYDKTKIEDFDYYVRTKQEQS